MEKRGNLFTIFVILMIVSLIFLVILYTVIESSLWKYVILGIIGLVVVFTLIDVLHEIFSAKRKLSRKLKKIEKMLAKESIDELKKIYADIYKLYLKLSEKKKGHFYEVIESVRELIERQLQAEKRVQRIIHGSMKKSVRKLKADYDELHKNFQLLPEKVKQKYYPHLVEMRGKLEKGK